MVNRIFVTVPVILAFVGAVIALLPHSRSNSYLQTFSAQEFKLTQEQIDAIRNGDAVAQALRIFRTALGGSNGSNR